MYKIKHIICFIFLSFFSMQAMAWWDRGHQAVAIVAYQHLTPSVREQVDSLAQVLSRDYPAVKSFSDMATWPDDIRKQDIESFTHWHYINQPYSIDGTIASSGLIDTDNAVWAVNLIQPILKNKRAVPAERARFLALLVHIVGDMHQPLHNVSLVSKNYPEGDQGGNLFMVKDVDNPENLIRLHTVWDNNFGQLSNESSIDVTIFAKEIMAKYPEKYFSQVNDLVAEHWSKEGYFLAKEYVYTLDEKSLPSLDYRMKTNAVIEQRIALAGYRLARLLNVLLEERRV